MCRVLEVSRSAYYKWKLTDGYKYIKHHEVLVEQIRNVYDKSKATYGSPRISIDLHTQGVKVSKSTIARVMSKNNIKSKLKKKYRPTTDSNHDYMIEPNVLDRQFNPCTLNEVWVSDITYIKIGTNWYYLTIIMDLANRMIIAWNLSSNLTAKDTIINCWNKALEVRTISQPLIFHSDRGVQYACLDFKQLLTKSKKVTQSMSRKGNCWDNAVAESFFKTLKAEFVNHNTFLSYNQAYRLIFNYIEAWYNTHRKHSSLNYLSPVQMYYLLISKKAA